MTDDPSTYETLTERLDRIMRQTFGDRFNAYFLGGPENIPQAALPCIITQKLTTDVDVGATMTDVHTDKAFIHIIVDGKDGFGASATTDTVGHQLELIVEGIDRSTGQYNIDTVLYAIRQNFTLDETVRDHQEHVDYAVTERKDQPSLREAIITVTAESHILVPNRY